HHESIRIGPVEIGPVENAPYCFGTAQARAGHVRARENGAAHRRLAEVSELEDRFARDQPIQLGGRERRALEVCSYRPRATEVHVGQVRQPSVDSVKLRPFEHGPGTGGSAEIQAAQYGAAQISLGEGRLTEARARQIRADQFRSHEAGPAEVRSLQVRSGEVGPGETGVRGVAALDRYTSQRR